MAHWSWQIILTSYFCNGLITIPVRCKNVLVKMILWHDPWEAGLNYERNIANIDVRIIPCNAVSVKTPMFTVPRTDVPGRKQPDETGRQGLYDAVKDTYNHCFPVGHACKAGPSYGMVARMYIKWLLALLDSIWLQKCGSPMNLQGKRAFHEKRPFSCR